MEIVSDYEVPDVVFNQARLGRIDWRWSALAELICEAPK
jgi:hypothetical protein